MSDPVIPPVVLRHPDTGEAGEYPAENATLLMQQGFKPLAPIEVRHWQATREQPLGPRFAAAGEGALETALPIVGPAIERLFVDPDEILKRREMYPGWHFAGSALGVLVPGLGELGVAGKGVQAASKLAAPNVIMRAGEAAAGAIPTTTALGRLTKAATDMGVQGALFGLADAGNRAVLGDPSLTAEHVLREVGDSALFGAGMGAGGSALVSAVKGLYGPAMHGLGTVAEHLASGDPAMAKFAIENRKPIAEFSAKIPGGTKTFLELTPSAQAAALAEQGAAESLLQIPEAVQHLNRSTPAQMRFVLDNSQKILKLERDGFPGLLDTLTSGDVTMGREFLDRWTHMKVTAEGKEQLLTAMREGLKTLREGVDDTAAQFWSTTRHKEIEAALNAPISFAGENRMPIMLTKEKALQAMEDARDAVKVGIREMRGDLSDESMAALKKLKGKKLEQKIAELDAELHPPGKPAYDMTGVRAFENQLGEFEKQIEAVRAMGGPKEAFEAIRGFRQNLDMTGIYDNVAIAKPLKNATLRELRGIRNEVGGILKDVQRFGAMAERESTLNKVESAFLKAFKRFDRRAWDPEIGDVRLSFAERYTNAALKGAAREHNEVAQDVMRTAREFLNEAERSGHDVAATRALLEKFDAQSREIMRDGVLRNMIKELKGEVLDSPSLQQMTDTRNLVMKALGYLGPGGMARRLVQALELARSPYVVAGVMNAMDHVAGAAAKALDSHVATLFKPVVAKGAAEAAAASTFEPFTPENYDQRMSIWNQAAANQEFVAQSVEGRMGPLMTTYPPLAGWLHIAAIRKAQHITTKAPKPVKIGLLDRPYRPSASELQTLNRHAEVMHDPYSVLARVAQGRFTEDHKQALDATAPATARQMREAVFSKLAELGPEARKLPRATKLGISQFLGIHLDGSASPYATLGTQRLYQSQVTPPQAAPVNERKIKNVDMKHTQMLATSTQATTRHLEGHS